MKAITLSKSNLIINKLFIVVLLTSAIIGCKPQYEYWDISKFNLKPDALADEEEVKLIYTSQGPDGNSQLEYYIHLIAVSQKTGDTVNILTTSDNGLKKEDGDSVFNYLSPDNPIVKLSQMSVDEISHTGSIDSLNKIELKKITKVARDPKFDGIANNNFPTVFGGIGKVVPKPQE